MYFCPHCGQEVASNADYCVHCEHRITSAVYAPNAKKSWFDPRFAVLGAFSPLLGLILFLVYRDSNPDRSKSAGLGALVRAILNLILCAIAILILLSYPSPQNRNRPYIRYRRFFSVIIGRAKGYLPFTRS